MFSRKPKGIAKNIYSCPKQWNDLEGDGFVRSCKQCKSKVYNLTGLTDEEVTEFVAANEGEVCALIHADENGYVVNGKCTHETKVRPLLGAVRGGTPSKAQVVDGKIQIAEHRLAALRRLREIVDGPGGTR